MEAIKTTRVIMTRLAPGADLLAELNRLVEKEKVELGLVSGIGALRKAAVGIFLQDTKEYRTNVFDEEMEICALTGNVSRKEGKPFVHAHLALSDAAGRGFGGHIMPGCEIFVAEVVIVAFEGPVFERTPQPECGGLWVWARANVGAE